jgi:predicted aspartyl protease
MAISYVEATVTGPTGSSETLEFLIDSGATYSVLPERTWERLGLQPKRTVRFRLADGTPIERQVSECHFRLAEGDGTSPVVLGEAEDVALLGVVTLEVLGLVFNPFTRTLHPMQMLLAKLVGTVETEPGSR